MKTERRSKQEMVQHMDRLIDRWRALPGDSPEHRKLMTQDRKNLRKVLIAFKKGNYRKAMEIAQSLDTIVRDEIPQDMWEIMDHHTTHEY